MVVPFVVAAAPVVAATPAILASFGGTAAQLAILAPYALSLAATKASTVGAAATAGAAISAATYFGASKATSAARALLSDYFVSSTLAYAGLEKGYGLARKGIIKGHRSKYKPVRAISKKAVHAYRVVSKPLSKGALGYIGGGLIRSMANKFR